MRILHTVAGLWTTTGGPASSIPGLCAALGRRGHDVTLLTGEGSLDPAAKRAASSVRVVTARLGPYAIGNYSAEFGRLCRELARESDVLHTHGLWLHPNFATSAAGADLGKPVVISPRGMLAPWALEQRWILKRLIWTIAQKRYVARAALVHVTSLEEEKEVRQVNVTTPIAVIPNGIDLDEFPLQHFDALRAGGRERVVLFLSRIHPKKGLDLLMDAWRMIAARHPEARMVIAGSGEQEYVDALRTSLAEKGMERVAYAGPLHGEEKLAAIARAAVLALPSRNENYGMVVAEALACGTPVLTTDAVPWPIAERRCGWRVAISADAIAVALDEALASSSDALDAMGRRGRQLIEQSHTTEIAAAAMEAAYVGACDRARRNGAQ